MPEMRALKFACILNLLHYALTERILFFISLPINYLLLMFNLVSTICFIRLTSLNLAWKWNPFFELAYTFLHFPLICFQFHFQTSNLNAFHCLFNDLKNFISCTMYYTLKNKVDSRLLCLQASNVASNFCHHSQNCVFW